MKFISLKSLFAFQLGVYFVSLFLFSNNLNGQNTWLQKAGGPTNDEGYSISTDGSGNTYATGYFSGTASFGSISLTASGVSDAFITKTSSNGTFLWAVKAGGSNSCRGLAIKADSAGNSYVTGYYYGVATFGGQTIISAGQQDVFIAKYNTAGSLLWVKSAGGPMADIGNAITIDNNGNIVVTGQFAGTATFGTFSLTSTNNNVNVFTAKLDGNGNFLWAVMGSGPHTNRGLGVGCDPGGNIYVTGQFSDTITFSNTHFSNLFDAIFLIKYNSAGVEQWFNIAGGGTSNIANGIAVDNNSHIYLTGNFTGTLSFFGTPTVTLTNKYANRVFVAKYNNNGKLLWDVSDGSSNSLTANAISLDTGGNPYIIGNFECRFNSYADQYGQGTFNTVGFWDIFVAEYSNTTGAWQWGRQIGGHLNNLGYSITVDGTGDIYTTGSFDEDMIVTGAASYIGYGTSPVICNSTYCSDANYGSFQYIQTSGASDIFIAEPIDLNRQPYDFYFRNGGACTRPVIGVVIDSLTADTVRFCSSGTVTAKSNTCSIAGPDYNYTWSNGGAGNSTTVNKTGWCYVTETSADGCFESRDSIYVLINPNPPAPTITDNLGININSQNPKPIIVCEKKVILTGGGFGANTYYWSGGGTNDSLVIAADSNGQYCFKVTDKLGCSNFVCVNVTIEDSLPPIKPGLKCTTCTHDSVTFCQGNSFTLFAFDSISNPGIKTSLCIPPGSPYIKNLWYISPDSASYSPITYCPGTNSFTPRDSGWYHITDTIIRKNLCDSTISVLHDSVFVRIHPNPIDSNLSIQGNNSICAGDSTLLIASGTNFTWSPSGSTNDSIWVGIGGYVLSSTVQNQYGCTASALAGFIVSAKASPIINITPANNIVCPGDSVQLVCSGIGNFQWQGPNGTIGTNDSTIYVSAPGLYYCVLSDTNLCTPVLSGSANVTLYSNPYLTTASQIICPGDSAHLYVVSSAGGTILWLPPLSGSDTSMFVTKGGTYSCQVSSCGIVTTCNITIIVSNPLATITASPAEIFCAGDSVILTANSGMVSYQWTPVSLNTQSITVKTPGTYTLVTMNSDGCLAAAHTIITEPAPINPQFTIINPLCNGDSGTIDAGNTTGGTPPYTYLWNNGYITSGIKSLTGSYTVTVTDSKGCTMVADTTMLQPAVLVAIDSATNAICYNGNGSITTTGSTGGTLPYTYTWSNGNISSSISTVAGTYSVIVKDMNGCMAVAKATILQPTKIMDSVVILAKIVCYGDSTCSAEVLVSGGVKPYTYLWNLSIPQTTPIVNGLPAGHYLVTITDSNGCVSNLTPIITQPAQVVTTAITKTICIGQTDTIFTSSTGGTPPYTYIWSTGSTSSSITVSPVVTTTYTIISTLDSNKCPGAADTVTVTVDPPLSVVTISPDTICPGGTALLNAKGSGGDGIYSYIWQAGNITGDSVHVSPLTDTTFTVTLTDACNSAAVTGKVTVVIASKPIVRFTADSLSGCSPLCVTFTDKSIVTGGSVSSVLWSFGNGDSSSQSPATYCYDSSSIYTIGLTVTSNDNCSASLLAPNMITVYSHPVAAFIYSPQQATTAGPIYFTNKSTDIYGITGNQWKFNEAPYDSINTDTNASYWYQDSGTFCPQLTVTNRHGCVSTTTQCIYVSPFFTIYIPNAFTPNQDGLNDVFSPKGDYICDFEMYIFDRWGMMLYYTQDLNKGWDGTIFGSSAIVQEDTYIYLIKLTDCLNQYKHSYTGKVTVIR